jgi:hypothetical protein
MTFFAVAAPERSNRCVGKGTSDGVVATINSARKFSDPQLQFLIDTDPTLCVCLHAQATYRSVAGAKCACAG